MTSWAYIAAGALAIILGLGVATKVQTSRLHAVQAEYATFQAEVKAKGEEQERKTKETIAANQKAKESTDAQNIKLRAANTALSDSLRRARASSRFVPAAAPGSASPDRACFSRTELERAIRQLDAGLSGLIGEGDAARIDLDSARDWAQGQVRGEIQP